MSEFSRELKLNELKGSAFLFGPRMVGKTHLLKRQKSARFFNLLDPESELNFSREPRRFWEEVQTVPTSSLIIVDEIQKVPQLLNYVQMGIEELGHRYILSGSSARKLKRGGANLLGGRASEVRLHPLTATEAGQNFSILHALQFGTLPKVSQLLLENELDEVYRLLRGYSLLYIKEEVQAESLTRNVGAFQRFLQVAVQCNAQIIEYANISRDCQVPSSTVKEYFQILEDTLLGFFLWPYDRSERKKARPKFYFVDCGIIRAIQNRLVDPPTHLESGFLFETWFINEIMRIRDYYFPEDELCFFRERKQEVDLMILRSGKPLLAFECKTGRDLISKATALTFLKRFPGTELHIASLHEKSTRKLSAKTFLHPWHEAIQLYRDS